MIELESINNDLLTKSLSDLELQHRILVQLLKEYDQEFDSISKQEIHNELSEVCEAIEQDKFFDYLFLKIIS